MLHSCRVVINHLVLAEGLADQKEQINELMTLHSFLGDFVDFSIEQRATVSYTATERYGTMEG